MATRMQKYPETESFHYHNANPRNRLDCDCVFRAISTALNQSWEQTVMEMAQLSCKTGYAITGDKCIGKYMEQKGWTKMPQPRKIDNKKFTGEEFCEVLTARNRNSEIVNEGWKPIVANLGTHHVACIMADHKTKSYRVWDTWDSTDGCIGNYWIKL